MGSLQQSNLETQVPADALIAQVIQIHSSICKLKSLKPCNQVNSLFTNLVNLCILPSSVDISTLPQEAQIIRQSLISLCGRGEGLLELEFANFLTKIPFPMNNLNLFPYYENYVKLAALEYKILKDNCVADLMKVAFVGSGPMPLTSYVLAINHLKCTNFDNFDIDEVANDVARRTVASDHALEKRMKFKTGDIMGVTEELGEYECIFLAALVGMNKEEKVKIIGHIRKYMKEGGFLLVRSAKGARAFLYPVVEEDELTGFEILSVYHPTDDVVNSVVLLRKPTFECENLKVLCCCYDRFFYFF